MNMTQLSSIVMQYWNKSAFVVAVVATAAAVVVYFFAFYLEKLNKDWLLTADQTNDIKRNIE